LIARACAHYCNEWWPSAGSEHHCVPGYVEGQSFALCGDSLLIASASEGHPSDIIFVSYRFNGSICRQPFPDRLPEPLRAVIMAIGGLPKFSVWSPVHTPTSSADDVWCVQLSLPTASWLITFAREGVDGWTQSVVTLHGTPTVSTSAERGCIVFVHGDPFTGCDREVLCSLDYSQGVVEAIAPLEPSQRLPAASRRLFLQSAEGADAAGFMCLLDEVGSSLTAYRWGPFEDLKAALRSEARRRNMWAVA
jgi:hypothetical protein